MSPAITDIDLLTGEAAARLLKRATDTRSVSVSSFTARVRKSLDKHVLSTCPDAAPPEIDAFFDALHVDDLCLAMACERGDEMAWTEFVRRYRSTVASASRGAHGSAAAATEVSQSLWAELYGLQTRSDGSPSGKLSHYSGCGPLGGWLRAVVCQMAAGWFRQTSRLVQPDDRGDRGDLRHRAAQAGGNNPPGRGDPQREIEAADAARTLGAVLFRALAALRAEDRLLIKMYYFEGLLLRQVGRALGVSEATASRRIGRLHKILRRMMEATLSRERNWSTEETTHALASVVPFLEDQLSNLFRAGPDAESSPRGLATRSRRGLT